MTGSIDGIWPCSRRQRSSSTFCFCGKAVCAVQAPRDLRASVYSDTTVALFWQRLDRDAWEIAQVEIYRDDELLAKTDHDDSYLDDTCEPERVRRPGSGSVDRGR